MSKGLYIKTIHYGGADIGGSIAHTVGMINGFYDCGVDLTVVLSEKMELVRARQQAFDAKYKKGRPYISDWLYHRQMSKAIKKWLAANRDFDFVYSRHRLLSSEGRTTAKLLGVPFVLEFNSFDSEMLKETIEGAMLKRHRKAMGLLIRMAVPVLRRIFMIGENKDLSAADIIVVVSTVMRDRLIQYGVESDRIMVLPNGVDPEMFENDAEAGTRVRKTVGISEHNVVVGFAGTFGNWHGIPELSDAIAKLDDMQQLSFLLMGDGSERNKMQQQLAHMQNVHFAGKVPFPEMPAYLSACDILVVTNSWLPTNKLAFFGSPTKLFEYMAMGKAIVASDLEQIGEILTNRKTAVLFPPMDSDGIKNAIVALVADTGLREHIGINARELAIREHTWQSNAEKVLAKLQDVD